MYIYTSPHIQIRAHAHTRTHSYTYTYGPTIIILNYVYNSKVIVAIY